GRAASVVAMAAKQQETAAIRGTDDMKDRDDVTDQSGLAPENFTTLAHFSVSSAMSFPKSAAGPGSIVPPRSASCAFSLGLARPELISLLSFPTISTGVFLGAPTPYHWLAS